MVPHSLSIAKRKLIHISKFAEILAKDWQFLGKLAWLNRLCHQSWNASERHLRRAIARLRGHQCQQPLCFNSNTYPRLDHVQKNCRRCLVRMPQHQRCLTCAISKCAYKNVRNTFERTPYSAAFLIRTAPHTYRSSRTTIAQNREPQLTFRTAWNDSWSSYLKCKQPPPLDGCLTPVPNRTLFDAS